MQNADTLT